VFERVNQVRLRRDAAGESRAEHLLRSLTLVADRAVLRAKATAQPTTPATRPSVGAAATGRRPARVLTELTVDQLGAGLDPATAAGQTRRSEP
jgi:hypothetical protein